MGLSLYQSCVFSFVYSPGDTLLTVKEGGNVIFNFGEKTNQLKPFKLWVKLLIHLLIHFAWRIHVFTGKKRGTFLIALLGSIEVN